MSRSNSIRHRLARWAALSKGAKFLIAIRVLRHRRLMDGLMARNGVPLEQTLLDRACNREATRRRVLDKAASMGARPNEPCDNRGGLAMHHYARHGLSPADAFDLLRRGFDPMALDAEGHCFAHHAFEFHNLAMARWIALLRPASWSLLSLRGATPMDLACAEPRGLGRGDPEPRAAFRDWAFSAMPSPDRLDFLANAWARAAKLLDRRAHVDCGIELAWLARLGPSAPAHDGPAILAEVDLCDPRIAERARPFFELAIAVTEREALRSAAGMAPAAPPARAPRSI